MKRILIGLLVVMALAVAAPSGNAAESRFGPSFRPISWQTLVPQTPPSF